MENFEIEMTDDGKIIDFISHKILEATPEEFVRQQYLRILHNELLYPKNFIATEVPIYHGRNPLANSNGSPIRADIVVYTSTQARERRDQGKIEFIVECKSPTENDGYNQLVSYVFNTSSNGAVWFNGNICKYYRRLSNPENKLIDWVGIPRYQEAWDTIGRRKKSDLIRPKDIKGLLRRCHNKLHGRGIDGEEEDFTMDMVRMILAKAADEEDSNEYPEFYCTPEEYSTNSGRENVAKRVQELFKRVVSENSTVFSRDERITVGERAICDVVNELQGYRLLSRLHESEDWDIMGYAYEQYTATYLKRQKGQFFTNRLIVNLMVEMLDPNYNDIILDPAGGTGGFLTGVMRYVRRKILNGKGNSISKERQLDKHRTNLYMIEQSKRLVKIAKTAMILNGDGHTGMTQGDSLDSYDKLGDAVKSKAGKEKPTIILTNPPFGGIGEGRITDPKILENYSCGMKWTEREGKLEISEFINEEGVPPEMLFFERCLDWIAPGGKVAIVLPKSFLDTQTYFTARLKLFNNCKLLAVINCHKNTFQPHTGVRTCIVIFYKPNIDENIPDDYSIFMALSKKIGQDSEGIPIFKRDEYNRSLNEIDHDLDEILKDYRNPNFTPSEYRFKVKRSQLGDNLCINPQFYLPSLNNTIRQIEAIEEIDNWTVTTLGQISPNIIIFKGPRIKTENIIVEEFKDGVELYYPPMAVLQNKAESAKLIDISKASSKQLYTIKVLRVKYGDLLITRSGTIGRVAYVTKRLVNAIVSDDMIRVRIPNEKLRFYVYAYLQSEAGYHQMLKNEYGAVQQHLEAKHISNILIPMPSRLNDIKELIITTKKAILAKEKYELESEKSLQGIKELINNLTK